jgi:radical SAM protein with 4Fe4S-binding SPASM domain
MRLRDARRRLPVVDALPWPRSRVILPLAPGQAPRPRIAVWELTLACDQACSHCGPRAGRARAHELDTEECLRLVAELAQAGVGEVALIGGEAYLRPDFVLVIRAIREHGMSCILTTGGYGMTAERAEAMVEAGIRSVSVSIDGLEPAHDRLRRRPQSFQRALRALRLCRDAGAKVAVNTQINALTWQDLPALLERLAPEGIHGWQLQTTVAHGNAADDPEILLQPHLYLELFPMLATLVERCDALGIRLLAANTLGWFGPYDHLLRRHQGPLGHYIGCEAGRSTVAIESDGAIKTCPSLGGERNVGGSWREHGFSAIWEQAPQMQYTRRRDLDDLWGFCRTCYYASVCMGGCTSVSEPLLGRPGNNPYCHHRVLELAAQGLRERIVRVARARGEPFDNALFQVIREPIDPDERARVGVVHVDEPRVSRAVEPYGAGYSVVLADSSSSGNAPA